MEKELLEHLRNKIEMVNHPSHYGGENNLYEAIDLILNGMPDDFDPFNTEDIKVYSDEQKAEWDKLYSELPIALDIVLFNGHFELNTYATQYHSRVWRVMR